MLSSKKNWEKESSAKNEKSREQNRVIQCEKYSCDILILPWALRWKDYPLMSSSEAALSL